MESLLNMAVRDDALGTVVRDNLVALHTDSRTSPSVRRNLGQACADISNTIFKAIEHRRTMQRIVELDHIPLPILYLGELYTQSPIKNQDEDCLAQDIRELEADDFARLHDTHPDLVLAREECAQLCKLALHSSIAQMQLHDSQPSTGAALYKYMTERVVLLAQAHAQQHGDAVLNEQLDHYLKLMTAQA
ncbi:MAG TPA: hypothetical protein VFS42_10565 [Burkholderiaceae bacterium]|nr:hypothetical protein [Burkholderiaceae bacterium]